MAALVDVSPYYVVGGAAAPTTIMATIQRRMAVI